MADPRAALDVGAWLQRLGLDEYEAAFRDNAVDGDVLPKLSAEDLREMGVTRVGHRRKLLEAIAALGAEPAAKEAAPPLPPPAPRSAVDERRQVTVLFADLAGY